MDRTGDVERALDAVTAALRVTRAERAAVRRYQAMGGEFERVNALYRGSPTASPLVPELVAVAKRLDALVSRARLPFDLVLYRGVRDLSAAVPPLPLLPAAVYQAGFTSTSLHRTIAARDFAGPDGAVLRIEVGAGTPGVWITPLGHRALRYEAEVLLARGTLLDHLRRRDVDGMVEVDCEVVS